MPDYQKMYTTLFNKLTDILEEMKEVQRLTEQMYMEDGEKTEEESSED